MFIHIYPIFEIPACMINPYLGFLKPQRNKQKTNMHLCVKYDIKNIKNHLTTIFNCKKILPK